MKHLSVVALLALSTLSSQAGATQAFAFGEPADAAKADRTVQVVLEDIAFEPKSLRVKAGETVRFVVINQGRLPHEFNLGDKAMHAEHQKQMLAMSMSVQGGSTGHGEHQHASHVHDHPNSVLVMPGQRAELAWTFKAGAPIEFACNVPGHYQAGMVGPLTIE